jgi:hypothetical protein
MEMRRVEHELLETIGAYARHLPAEQVKEMTELVNAGEPGVAFENLCTQLFEYDVSVEDRAMGKLRGIGDAMGLHPKYWERLKVSK